jgi:myo-inositol 2-dehydrogenase/D-chiro-inositol 1-dehydrogenase
MSSVKLGLIGAGRIGKIHAENLVRRIPGADLRIICDSRLESAQDLANSLGVSQSTQDPRDLLKNSELDGIVICSSTETHAELIEESALARKHIFCEKPIDLDVSRVRRILDTVAKSGVKFQLGFNRRFDPTFKSVREAVKAGKIGTPQVVKITSRDPQPPSLEYSKGSGGIFMDMMIHDFDMARFLVQEEVIEVYAAGSTLIQPEISQWGDFDTAVVTLRYTSGAFCTIDCSRKAVYGYDQRLEVFGSGGCVSAPNEFPERIVIMNEKGVQQALPHHFFLERYKDAYVDELTEFVQCLNQPEKQPSVSGLDGLNSLLIALAAQKSAVEKRPVTLEEVSRKS